MTLDFEKSILLVWSPLDKRKCAGGCGRNVYRGEYCKRCKPTEK